MYIRNGYSHGSKILMACNHAQGYLFPKRSKMRDKNWAINLQWKFGEKFGKYKFDKYLRERLELWLPNFVCE